MKKTVVFELFEKNQYIYFDILRLAELEKALGASIVTIMNQQEAGVNFCIQGLICGLKHHYHKATALDYAQKIEAYLDEGGSLSDVAIPIIRAIILSGILGKEVTKTVLSRIEGEKDYQEEESAEKNVQRTA